MHRPGRLGAVPLSLLAGLIVVVGLLPVAAPSRASSDPRVAGAEVGALGPTDPILVAGGDIACDPRNPAFRNGKGTATLCRQRDVAELIETLDPDMVMPLGDTQYDHGQRKAYNRSYDPSWGRFLDITTAVVGNHEYETKRARGYFGYFGEAAGPKRGYFARNLGTWRIIVLNSNCWVRSCDPGEAQMDWLQDELRDHPHTCTLAAWHHPRWSSGLHGNDANVGAFVRLLGRRGVDVILNGHDHHYERFARRGPTGAADPSGFSQFIVGTGGAQLYPIGKPAPKSDVRRSAYGVLALTLQDGSYGWDFERLEPGPADNGQEPCSA